jgi:hypothetical protein
LRIGQAGHFFARGGFHELANAAGAAAERADLWRREPVLEEIALSDARALLREELPRGVAPGSAGADVQLDVHSCHEYRCSSNGKASL